MVLYLAITLYEGWSDAPGPGRWHLRRRIERAYPSVPRPGDVIEVEHELGWEETIHSVSWMEDGEVWLDLGPVYIEASGENFSPERLLARGWSG